MFPSLYCLDTILIPLTFFHVAPGTSHRSVWAFCFQAHALWASIWRFVLYLWEHVFAFILICMHLPYVPILVSCLVDIDFMVFCRSGCLGNSSPIFRFCWQIQMFSLCKIEWNFFAHLMICWQMAVRDPHVQELCNLRVICLLNMTGIGLGNLFNMVWPYVFVLPCMVLVFGNLFSMLWPYVFVLPCIYGFSMFYLYRWHGPSWGPISNGTL